MASRNKPPTIDALASILQLNPADLLEKRNLDNMLVGEFLRQYASAPEAVDLDARSSFREDSAINSLSDILAQTPGDVNVTDLCCGVAPLAKRVLQSAPDDCGRIHYLAVDRDPICIDGVRANLEAFQGFKSFNVLQREILDLGGVPPTDLIVFNNTLHEVPPHTFPDVFEALNGTLRSGKGRISIVDMEELPQDAPESIAITWSADEIVTILKAAGFSPVVTRHAKSVGVYRADVRHVSDAIDKPGVFAAIERLIRTKLMRCIERRKKLRVSAGSAPEELHSWLVETGQLARLSEELHQLQPTSKS